MVASRELPERLRSRINGMGIALRTAVDTLSSATADYVAVCHPNLQSGTARQGGQVQPGSGMLQPAGQG